MIRKPLLILLTLIALLLGGIAAGALLGWRLDPRAPICRTLGACALPTGLIACMASWYGARSFSAVAAYPKLLMGRSSIGEANGGADLEGERGAFLPATLLFIPICALIGAAFGFVMAYYSTALFVSSFFGMGFLGAGYGWLIHAAANSGLLLRPEAV